jgi:hypothetical protein
MSDSSFLGTLMRVKRRRERDSWVKDYCLSTTKNKKERCSGYEGRF